MKKGMSVLLIVVILSIFSQSAFTQEMGLLVSGLNPKSVTKENLVSAKTLKDINPGYPASWVSHYISVELLSTYNGIVTTAISTNDTLTQDQQDILNIANIGALIEVKAKYSAKNRMQKSEKQNLISFSFSVVPAIEAEFQEGYENLLEYLTSETIDKIADGYREQIGLAEVSFTINEEGKTSNVKIAQTSQNDEVDALLLKAINDMPSWKPAEHSDGTKIAQEFKLLIGNSIGC